MALNDLDALVNDLASKAMALNDLDALVNDLASQVIAWETYAGQAARRVPEFGPDDMSSQEDDTMAEVYAEAASAIRKLLEFHGRAMPAR